MPYQEDKEPTGRSIIIRRDTMRVLNTYRHSISQAMIEAREIKKPMTWDKFLYQVVVMIEEEGKKAEQEQAEQNKP